METIKVVIDKTGAAKVETKGFHGKACIEASKAIEEALGNITEMKRTGEYYEEEIKETIKVKNGNR